MSLIASKLILPAVLILLASLAARRWGDAIGGWLVGLPLTTGPVVAFLAIQYGPEFAARAADGSIVGAAGQAAFAIGYASAARMGWMPGFCAGAIAFAAAVFVLQMVPLPHWVLFAAALATLSLAARLIPHRDHMPSAVPAPWWDLPARMIVATVLVVGLTAAAAFVGAQTAGALASFPIFGATLTIFAHRMRGPMRARQVLRGLVLSLYGFAACFFLISVLLVPVGIAPALMAAAVATFAVQAAALYVIRKNTGALDNIPT
jgi:hypothetical protein